MLERFGKSAAGMFAIKRDFFDQNAANLQKQDQINEIYLEQPLRTNCKNCGTRLSGPEFESHRVRYCLCQDCGHLNGTREESEDFFHRVYHQDEGKSYGNVYNEVRAEDFSNRVRTIYRPKAAFLRESLDHLSLDAKALSVCDFGAGSGYFVAALAQEGFDARGLEVSSAQVALGNRMLHCNALDTFQARETTAILRSLAADIICLIGVLEHLPSPREALNALRENPATRFLYISVPLFSPAVLFELLFPGSFNRQLGGSHTHLYSLRSIDHFCNEYGFEIQARWLFGTDIMDLYRHTMNSLRAKDLSQEAIEALSDMILPQIDALQLCIDKAAVPSEGHFLLEKRR